MAAAPSREWTDSTGKYHVRADLIAQSEDLVVLQKENHTLVAVPIKKLSQRDQDFLRSRETREHVQRSADQMQTWTMRSGLKVRGKVVDYARREITIQRRRNKVYVNDKLFQNLPEVYRRMAPKIVSHIEKMDVPDEKAFEAWVGRLRGEPRTYTLEGVVLELENGDEYGVPFFLFSDHDLRVLQPGWQQWLAATKIRRTRRPAAAGVPVAVGVAGVPAEPDGQPADRHDAARVAGGGGGRDESVGSAIVSQAGCGRDAAVRGGARPRQPRRHDGSAATQSWLRRGVRPQGQPLTLRSLRRLRILREHARESGSTRAR